MIYILDSSFFIDASRLHLPLNKYPAFWDWLITLAEKKTVSIPEKIYEELSDGNDSLAIWVNEHKKVLVNQLAAFAQIRRVMAEGYNITKKSELQGLKADPWVIAHALAVDGTVVTSEKPGKQTNPLNKKIPSVCAVLGVPCCTITAFLWQMRSSMPV